jgi:hypothetical protein
MADIFSDIFKFAGSVINQAITPDNLRDQRHASKLFVDDQYKLLPKMGYLYHVFFDIDTGAAFPDPTNPNNIRELGLLVKNVSLPKFTVDTKRYNAYNRPNYAQTKVNYDAINIGFHDDSANVVRNFWFDYYNYYYRDADYDEALYGGAHKYEPTRPTDKWGYSPRNNVAQPYLKSIRIYSLHQKKFSEYVLLNPIIKSFRHGEHAAGQNEIIGHEMTIEYESVLYFYGTTSSNTVKGFADLHYDKMPSPLTPAGGGTKSILGPGGLLDMGDDVIHDIKDGNYGSALFKGLKGLKNASSMDLKKAAIGEVLAMGTGVLRGNNPQNNIFVPSLPSLGGAVSSIGGQLGISGLLSGGGFGGGGSWLAGAAGLGLTALASGGTRSEEMTDASSYLEGIAPYSEYNEFPSPTEEDVVAAGYNQSTSASDEVRYSDEGDSVEPTNQASVNGYGNKLSIENNIDTTKRNMLSLQNEANSLKEQRRLAEDAITSLDSQRGALIAAGADPNSREVREIQKQIEQQIDISSTNDAVIDQLNSQFAGLNSNLSRLNSQYNTLT